MKSHPRGDLASQPTVKEVARLAGVSPMTVSRTLAGGKNVRAELQERVLEAVQQLGYHRNENARSLRPGQPSGLVGVAITNLGNPYYGNFALGVEEIAAHYGRRIILGSTGEDPVRERQLIADFIGRQVEGLVLVPSGQDADALQPDSLQGTPMVLASRMVAGVDVDSVVLDDVGGAYRGTKSVLDDGHRRVGYLGNASVFTERRRFEGFSRALADFGVEADAALIRRGQQDVESARLAMKYLLDLPEPPTAVFSANNRNTIGALKEIGTRLDEGGRGDGLPTIVSFDDFELAEMMPVPVTVVDHDARELGREAAQMLFARLADPRRVQPTRQLEIPTFVRVVRS